MDNDIKAWLYDILNPLCCWAAPSTQDSKASSLVTVDAVVVQRAVNQQVTTN